MAETIVVMERHLNKGERDYRSEVEQGDWFWCRVSGGAVLLRRGSDDHDEDDISDAIINAELGTVWTGWDQYLNDEVRPAGRVKLIPEFLPDGQRNPAFDAVEGGS